MKTLNHYTVKWTNNQQLKIIDDQEGYTLNLTLLENYPIEFQHALFNVEDLLYKGAPMWVTGRSLKEYDPDIRNLEINPSLQYVEVGAGLGEFIPHVVRSSENQSEMRPIAIDPVNYELMQKILVHAKTLEIGNQMQNHLKELIERCEIMLDSDKVQLINSTLEHTIISNPNLLGIADIVIDNAGANHYTPEGHEHIWQLEKQLLKPNGRIFSEVVNSSGVYRPQN